MFNYLEIKKNEVKGLQFEQKMLNDQVISINRDFSTIDKALAQLRESKTDYLNCDLEAVKKFAENVKALREKKCEHETRNEQLSQEIASLDRRIHSIHTDLKVVVKEASNLDDNVKALASVLKSAVAMIQKYIEDENGFIKAHSLHDANNINYALKRAVELQQSLTSQNPPFGFIATAPRVEKILASFRSHMDILIPDIQYMDDNLPYLSQQLDIATHWSQSTKQTLIEHKRTLEEAQVDNVEAQLKQTRRSLEVDRQNNSDIRSQITQDILKLEQKDTPVLVLNLFRKMQEAQSTDFSPEARERIVSLEFDPLISSFEARIQPLLNNLLSIQQKLSPLEMKLEQESILLSEQYRKASFLVGALACVGMSAAIIVSYMLSSVVLVAIAGLVAVCAARQAYYFFNESKKYPKEPILQESEQSPVSNGWCCA